MIAPAAGHLKFLLFHSVGLFFFGWLVEREQQKTNTNQPTIEKKRQNVVASNQSVFQIQTLLGFQEVRVFWIYE